MRLNYIYLLLLLFSYQSKAFEFKTDIVISPQPMNYSGPANSVMPGNIIGSQWSATASVKQVFWCGTIWICQQGTMKPGEHIASGFSVNLEGANYDVFETGVPGIGYILGIKDFNGGSYLPLKTVEVQTYPAEGTNGYAMDLGWSAKITFVKTSEQLSAGVYQLPQFIAARLWAKNGDGEGNANIVINPTTLTVAASGCTVNTPNVNVRLGDINLNKLPSVGSTAGAAGFNINLKCDPNVIVKAVISDQSHPGNYSDAVGLTSDSTAYGIGIAFYYNGTGPLGLGRDSASANEYNQFYVATTADSTQLSLPFEVRYIRKLEKVSPGSANALAGITFSYQ